jgi:hypothetical protein
VATEGDEWLSREMGGKVGRAPACYGSSLGSNLDISQKYKMGDMSKGVANTLKHAKKYTKKYPPVSITSAVKLDSTTTTVPETYSSNEF